MIVTIKSTIPPHCSSDKETVQKNKKYEPGTVFPEIIHNGLVE